VEPDAADSTRFVEEQSYRLDSRRGGSPSSSLAGDQSRLDREIWILGGNPDLHRPFQVQPLAHRNSSGWFSGGDDALSHDGYLRVRGENTDAHDEVPDSGFDHSGQSEGPTRTSLYTDAPQHFAYCTIPSEIDVGHTRCQTDETTWFAAHPN
jgi:hypothetical protein